MFEKLKTVGNSLKREIRFYQMVMQDTRTPRVSKILLGIAVSYVLLPFDIIPDFIPVIGHVDDAIIVPALVLMALRKVPRSVLDDCRLRATSG
ncbi:MAG: YkvA family protein [Nitrospiraceae bacterium]